MIALGRFGSVTFQTDIIHYGSSSFVPEILQKNLKMIRQSRWEFGSLGNKQKIASVYTGSHMKTGSSCASFCLCHFLRHRKRESPKLCAPFQESASLIAKCKTFVHAFLSRTEFFGPDVDPRTVPVPVQTGLVNRRVAAILRGTIQRECQEKRKP